MNNTIVGARSAEILLVEDNEDDVMLTRLAFGRPGIAVQLHHARNGEEGIFAQAGRLRGHADPT